MLKIKGTIYLANPLFERALEAVLLVCFIFPMDVFYFPATVI
jgi:hypothetical protein